MTVDIEFREESRLMVWTIRVDDVFVGLLVKRVLAKYRREYEIHQWDSQSKGFTLFRVLVGVHDPNTNKALLDAVKEMVS